MSHHQQRRSQRRPTHHRLRVNTTNAAPLDTPRPGWEAANAPDTDIPTSGPQADLGVISPLSQVSHTQPTVPLRFMRRYVGLPTVLSVVDHSSIHVSMASAYAKHQATSAPLYHGSHISVFPTDQDEIL
jgi:hypothetical protein